MRAPADPDPGNTGPGEPGGALRMPVILWIILVLSILPEIVLQGSDMGLWGQPGWRALVYQYGAFWAGLLDNWRPNYPGQPLLMFITYGFLHSGLWHMALNMVTLVSLGRVLIQQMGQRRFMLLYLLSMTGGALAFAMFGPVTNPMVGASGALFGLAGALLVDLYWESRQWQVLLVPLAGLIALNVVMYFAMDGLLAWQTHLGGFLAGAWVMGFYHLRQSD